MSDTSQLVDETPRGDIVDRVVQVAVERAIAAPIRMSDEDASKANGLLQASIAAMGAVTRRGSNPMYTFTGRRLDPLNLQVSDVEVRDIAHSLGYQCRYAGHVRAFYSVAEHSVLMSRYASKSVTGPGVMTAKCCLIHDASEAYFVDIPSPVKKAIHEVVKPIERRIQGTICERFGIPFPWPVEVAALVKSYDFRMITTERNALRVYDMDHEFDYPLDPLPVEIEGWSPERAENEWLNEFNFLWGQS